MAAELGQVVGVVARGQGTNLKGVLRHLWKDGCPQNSSPREDVTVGMLWFISGVGAETPFARDKLKYQQMSFKLHPKEGESSGPHGF